MKLPDAFYRWLLALLLTLSGCRSVIAGEYAADLCINAQGDPFKTANGTDLRLQIPLRVVACPPELPMGTKLEVEDVGLVTCLDRGGAIKKKRLDLWLGHGNEAVDLYLETGYLSGLKKVYRIL